MTTPSSPALPLPTVIIGCGNIAKTYAKQLQSYPEIALAGFSDLMPERAEEFAGLFGGRAYRSMEEVLEDPKVALVVNLTIHHAHAEVIERCLEAGKHVHTEKPLALHYADAKRLMELAEARGLRLSSAPITYMGEAHQTAMRVIREGKLGTVRLIYAEVNHGRIESWHPNPEPFYAVGPLWDVGIYSVTAITAALGRVAAVRAWSRTLYPDRVTKEGRAFRVGSPDCYMAELEMGCGAVARLTVNFYAKSKQGGALEYLGDAGSVYVGNFQRFDAAVEYAPWGGAYEPVSPLQTPFEGIEFGRGVRDLALALTEGRPHRAGAAHAAHVVEVLEAVERSGPTGERVEVVSDFLQPPPMDWAV